MGVGRQSHPSTGSADGDCMMATAAPSTALPSQGIWASSLISDLHRRAVPVLVYSMHTDPWRVGSAFEAGALGYVTKRAFHTMLVQGIRDVAAGRRFFSPCAAALAENLTGSLPEDSVQNLSHNEQRSRRRRITYALMAFLPAFAYRCPPSGFPTDVALL